MGNKKSVQRTSSGRDEDVHDSEQQETVSEKELPIAQAVDVEDVKIKQDDKGVAGEGGDQVMRAEIVDSLNAVRFGEGDHVALFVEEVHRVPQSQCLKDSETGEFPVFYTENTVPLAAWRVTFSTKMLEGTVLNVHEDMTYDIDVKKLNDNESFTMYKVDPYKCRVVSEASLKRDPDWWAQVGVHVLCGKVNTSRKREYCQNVHRGTIMEVTSRDNKTMFHIRYTDNPDEIEYYVAIEDIGIDVWYYKKNPAEAFPAN